MPCGDFGNHRRDDHGSEREGQSTGQGITPSDLDSALEAVRGDLAYANMHTSFPGGEIRGQVRRGAGGNH